MRRDNQEPNNNNNRSKGPRISISFPIIKMDDTEKQTDDLSKLRRCHSNDDNLPSLIEQIYEQLVCFAVFHY